MKIGQMIISQKKRGDQLEGGQVALEALSGLERGGFSQACPCTVIYFAYGVLADTILNFQLGGISGGITVFKRRPASHAPPAAGDLSAH